MTAVSLTVHNVESLKQFFCLHVLHYTYSNNIHNLSPNLSYLLHFFHQKHIILSLISIHIYLLQLSFIFYSASLVNQTGAFDSAWDQRTIYLLQSVTNILPVGFRQSQMPRSESPNSRYKKYKTTIINYNKQTIFIQYFSKKFIFLIYHLFSHISHSFLPIQSSPVWAPAGAKQKYK